MVFHVRRAAADGAVRALSGTVAVGGGTAVVFHAARVALLSVNAVVSPTLFSNVLACAIEQGFAEATLCGEGVLPGSPAQLSFGTANVEQNAASIVLTFAQKNGFRTAAYYGGTVVNVPAADGQVSPYVANPIGITLPVL